MNFSRMIARIVFDFILGLVLIMFAVYLSK